MPSTFHNYCESGEKIQHHGPKPLFNFRWNSRLRAAGQMARANMATGGGEGGGAGGRGGETGDGGGAGKGGEGASRAPLHAGLYFGMCERWRNTT